MAMACFASAGLSFSVLVRSRTVQVVAPRVPLRKLSSTAAGRETLPVWEAERMGLSYADHRVIEREETERSASLWGPQALLQCEISTGSASIRSECVFKRKTYPITCIERGRNTGYT